MEYKDKKKPKFKYTKTNFLLFILARLLVLYLIIAKRRHFI